MEGSDRSFEISACLGRGGFGEVYRARMSRTGGLPTDVALKVLRRDIDPDGQAVQRLRDEGRLLSQLNHPAILKVHDLVVLGGRISLITEFVDGDDLTACLRAPQPIGPRGLLQVVARVAGALDAAWTARPAGADAPLRMVHRDIKPSNIRLSRHGDVKLLDFGIARTDAVEREARTRTDMMVGSPAYMAPERFLEKTILLESDVFSLGAVLYEGLAGGRFYGDLPVPMQVGLAVDDLRFAEFLTERLGLLSVGGELLGLLTRALSYEPTERPSPAELARLCDALADHTDGDTLARYCRGRAWSTMAPVAGELDGQTLSEGTLERPRPRPIEREPLAPVSHVEPEEVGGRAGTVWGWVLVGVGATGLLGTVVVGLLSVLGVMTLPWAMSVEEPVAAVPASSPPEPTLSPSEPAPTVSEPTPIGEPEGVAEPVAPVSRPRPAPSSEPPPPSPRSRAPAPPSAPEGPAPGRVEVSGDVVALATGPGGTHYLPGELAPGVYQVKAKYNGRDAVEAGELVVVSGQTHVVGCSSRMTRCTIR